MGFWNLVATIGSLILATGILLFLINIRHTHRKAPPEPLDSWDARTVEWMTTSPPNEHNFDAVLEVRSLDDFFHRKNKDVGEGDQHDLRPVATAEEILAEQEAHADHRIDMPSPSSWPIIVAFALPIIAFGIIYNPLISIAGAVLLVFAVFGWALEPSVAPESDYDPQPTARCRHHGGHGQRVTSGPTATRGASRSADVHLRAFPLGSRDGLLRGLSTNGDQSARSFGLDTPCQPPQQVVQRAAGESPADDSVADPPNHTERHGIGPVEAQSGAFTGVESLQLPVERWKQPFPARRLPGHGHHDPRLGGPGDTQLQHHFLVHAGTSTEIDAQVRRESRVMPLVDDKGVAEQGAGIIEDDFTSLCERHA